MRSPQNLQGLSRAKEKAIRKKSDSTDKTAEAACWTSLSKKPIEWGCIYLSNLGE